MGNCIISACPRHVKICCSLQMRLTGAFKSFIKLARKQRKYTFLTPTWCRRHNIRHAIVFIVFLFPVVMKFYSDVYCVFYTK